MSDEHEQEKPNPLLKTVARLIHELWSKDGHPTIHWWRGEFWVWKKNYYRRVDSGEIQARILRWLAGWASKASPKWSENLFKMLKASTLVLGDIDQPAWLEGKGSVSSLHLVALRNGLLNVDGLLAGKPGHLESNNPKWFSPTALTYNYEPEAKCPQWDQFMGEVFDGDQDRIKLLQEWFGYCLTADTSRQAILMLEGPRRSGKGTTLKVLQKLIGEDNCTQPRLSTLGSMFGMWGLIGKSVAICSDVSLPNRASTIGILEILKTISGEDTIEIHRKNLSSISVRLPIRFTLAVNELPQFADASNALGSRMLILPYRNSYVGKEDRNLEKKLASETPGIFLWAIEGLKRLQTQGEFTVPEISRAASEDFARLSSPLQAFLEDCCKVGSDLEVGTDILWDEWIRWCGSNSEETGTIQQFGTKMRAAVPGLTKFRPRDAGGRIGMYRGVGLQPLRGGGHNGHDGTPVGICKKEK